MAAMTNETSERLFGLHNAALLAGVLATLATALVTFWQFSGWYHDDMTHNVAVDRRLDTLERQRVETEADRQARWNTITNGLTRLGEDLAAVARTQEQNTSRVEKIQDGLDAVLRQVGAPPAVSRGNGR